MTRFLLLNIVLVLIIGSVSHASGRPHNIKRYTLNLTSTYGAPDGFARAYFQINGRTPGPLIEANQGQVVLVNVINGLTSQVSLHWHGLHQRGVPQFDGVAGVNQYAIPPGANFTYEIRTDDNYGPYWYHAHLRDLYSDGLRGPLLIHPKPSIPRPYKLISQNEGEVAEMLAAEKEAHNLMVNDWFHQTGEDRLARLKKTGDSMRSLCASSILFNGVGQVNCRSDGTFGCDESPISMALGRAGMLPFQEGASTMPAEAGSTPPDRCVNTTTDPYVFGPRQNRRWFLINVINAGTAQKLSFSIDAHNMWIVSADGVYVRPQHVQAFDIGIGQRYGVLVKRPVPGAARNYSVRASTRTHQTYEGTAMLRYAGTDSKYTEILRDVGTTATAKSMLDETSLVPFMSEEVCDSNRFLYMDVNQTNPRQWVLEGKPFSHNNGQATPLLFDPQEGAAIHRLNRGDVIDVVLQVTQESMDQMGHPIHFHGHYFRVLGSMSNSTFPKNSTVTDILRLAPNSSIANALNVGPSASKRDTAHLPEAGWLALRIVSGNPGVWLLHCHIGTHLSGGMAVAFVELQNEFPTFPQSATTPPQIAPWKGIADL